MGHKGNISCGVCIIWLVSAIITSVSEAVELHTVPTVNATCGDNVTLTCKASSPRQMDVKSFLWMVKGETVCKYVEGHLPNNTPCEYSPQNTLTLTLTDVMPVHVGEYRCKIRTTAGVSESVTRVEMHNCFGSFTFSENSTHATCLFKDVYPFIYIPWFHGDTEVWPVLTEDTEDQYLRKTIWSTLEVDTRNLSQPYRCCLFGFSGTVSHCQTLKLTSSGSTLRLQWMLPLLEILLVKSFT